VCFYVFCATRGQLSDMVCGYVKQLFIEDKSREVTLEVSDMLFTLLKFHCANIVLATFSVFLRLMSCARMVRY